MSLLRPRPVVLGLSGALLFVLACVGAPNRGSDLGEELRIGVLPGASAERLTARYGPLLDYLDKTLNTRCRLVVPDSYEHLLALFASGEVDLASFGGVTFAVATKRYDAKALVMRDSDLRFTSYILVRSDHPAKTLEDLEGESLAFGSKLSTSGHVMPRLFLEEADLPPESHFSRVVYSGRHDTTLQWVQDGKVTAGAASARWVETLFASGAAAREEIRILWESPPYVDYVWAAQESFSEHALARIRDAFLDLRIALPAHEKVLSGLDARYFVPADATRFERLATEIEGLPELTEIAR